MNCITCNEPLNGPWQKKFCSRSCAATHNNTAFPKRIKKTQAPKESRSDKLVRLWLSGEHPGGNEYLTASWVKRYLVQTRGNQCEQCGWSEVNPTTGRVPLDLHHIGETNDHRPENLQLLCPNCHSLTPTYKALNKGKGRPWAYRQRPS